MEIGKRIKAHLALKRAKEKVDRDREDPRPSNIARDRFKAAEVVKKAETKQEVLGLIQNSRIGIWTDYGYKESYHSAVQWIATKRAKDLGATEEEIDSAIEDGDIAGATLRSGMEI